MPETPLPMKRVEDLFSWAYAWRADDGDRQTNLGPLRAKQRIEFQEALAEHEKKILAAVQPVVPTREDVRSLVEEWSKPFGGDPLLARRTVDMLVMLDAALAEHEKPGPTEAVDRERIIEVRPSRMKHPGAEQYPFEIVYLSDNRAWFALTDDEAIDVRDGLNALLPPEQESAEETIVYGVRVRGTGEVVLFGALLSDRADALANAAGSNMRREAVQRYVTPWSRIIPKEETDG